MINSGVFQHPGKTSRVAHGTEVERTAGREELCAGRCLEFIPT